MNGVGVKGEGTVFCCLTDGRVWFHGRTEDRRTTHWRSETRTVLTDGKMVGKHLGYAAEAPESKCGAAVQAGERSLRMSGDEQRPETH